MLWGKNLTDRLYAVTAKEVPVRDRYEKLGPPRQYGATLQYQF
jgi:outer membrane receptor protein involved in Fe transport